MSTNTNMLREPTCEGVLADLQVLLGDDNGFGPDLAQVAAAALTVCAEHLSESMRHARPVVFPTDGDLTALAADCNTTLLHLFEGFSALLSHVGTADPATTGAAWSKATAALGHAAVAMAAAHACVAEATA
ncbi:hypothetical protein Lfu02_77180 [Longispora fulva]|uniref:Uncharacterized protein n=1 Tax=Longispora fulva TaxID=619741 RepID=A0A8J7GH76_9ACTN|nr:hypothetical protein [Longispora fulva]MBG6136163.1 hypothetical protein [Longispora fulva]GIG63346.1 hypothetical protein Lfu02_77180 [Longispora fulva]